MTAIEIEIRAAELVAFANEGRLDEMSPTEFDWFVHGDSPAHCVSDCTPVTDEESAALLAHWIDNHDFIVESERPWVFKTLAGVTPKAQP